MIVIMVAITVMILLVAPLPVLLLLFLLALLEFAVFAPVFFFPALVVGVFVDGPAMVVTVRSVVVTGVAVLIATGCEGGNGQRPGEYQEYETS